MEIERKWLFDINKVPVEKSPTVTYYAQTYLDTNPEVRIRSKLVKGNPKYCFYDDVACQGPTYALTIKGNGGMSRVEVQKELTKEEFEDLKSIKSLNDNDFIHKSYYTILVDQYVLTVGTVDEGKPSEFCYGEIEFSSEEEAKLFTAPEWFGEEVTCNQAYKMKNYWKVNYEKVDTPIKVSNIKRYLEIINSPTQKEYNKQTIEYAIRWAEFMEKSISKGNSIKDVVITDAIKARVEVDNYISYQKAISFLSEVWEYGDRLNGYCQDKPW